MLSSSFLTCLLKANNGEIKYLILHLIFTALMDENWSFGRELQLFPTGGPSCLSCSLASGAAAGRADEGHGQNEAECPETIQPRPCGFKVDIDIKISAEPKQSSAGLIKVLVMAEALQSLMSFQTKALVYGICCYILTAVQFPYRCYLFSCCCCVM